MVAIVYFLPALACLVLHFGFRFSGDWTAYAWVFGCGEVTVGLLHWAFYRSFTSCREYLGSTVSSIHYEAPWTQIVIRYETRTDGKGRTYTVTRREYVYHPAKYYFKTTIGSRFATNSSFFQYVQHLWMVPVHPDRWYGAHIVGGVRTGSHYNFNDLGPVRSCDTRYWVPITESHRYKNKIRCSNSIFKFEKISREEALEAGLVDYPPISDNDAPCILSRDFGVPQFADDLFRKFNAGIAPGRQMRLYIILFNHERGIGTSEMQRAYWQGGNKNELVVCVGIDPSGSVHWARAFSWADEQQVEVEVARWLMDQKTLNWPALFGWLQANIHRWKRKEFHDFDYIHVTLQLRHFLWLLFLSLLENALLIYLILQPLRKYF